MDMDNMSFKVPLSRVLNCFSFNYLEYDTALPSIVEGRIHPIQFSNCITRINVAARTHRDKNLFLLIMFFLGLAVLIAYPFVDTTYYMYIVLLFIPLCIVEYTFFCLLKRKTLNLLGVAVEQENEIFQTNGMRLIWQKNKRKIIVEVVRRVSLSYENSVLLQTVQQERERNSRQASSSSLLLNHTDINNEKAPLLSSQQDEIEVPEVLSPSHSSHPSILPSHIFAPPAHVQIPVE